jgi:hypothetical protein
VASFAIVMMLVTMAVTGVGGQETTSSPLVKSMVVKMHHVAAVGVAQVPGHMGDRMRFLMNDSALTLTESTSISVMEASNLKQLADIAGVARRNAIKVADSGAAVHVVTSRHRARPGTIRANTLRVSTANGSIIPPEKCDADLDIGMEDGTVRTVILRDALIMKSCGHELISLGKLAREENVGTTLSPGGKLSYLSFGSQRAPLINFGVILVPHVDAAWSTRAAALLSQGACGYSTTPAVARGQLRGKNLAPRVVHCRANHRRHEVVNAWHKCSNAPKEWRADTGACDDCLTANATKIHSDSHVPPATKPGHVSFDVMALGVKHVHGGQSKVLGIHDHYSTFTWVRLLNNETEGEFIEAWREYDNFCKSVGVCLAAVHTDNFSSHVGSRMRAFMRDELKVHYTTITPNEPRQNGMMERQWRTMGNDTRALLEHSKLTRNYAWYALSESVQVANTLPIAGNETQCAHKLFTGHTPNVTHFRVFGCMMYAKIYDPVTKMANRAMRGIHLRRCTHQPGYEMLEPETGKVHVTVHCRFVETECPGLTLAKEGWEQAMPSFSDVYDDTATRVADAPILQDMRSVLEPAPEPLFSPAPLEEPAQPAAQAPMAGMEPTPARPRRGAANYGNQVIPFNGAFKALRTAMVAVAAALAPGGQAYGTQVLALNEQAKGSYVLYLCSGVPREGDLQHWIGELSAAESYVINVDTERGGHSHDLRSAVVTDRLVELASSPNCLGVLATLTCGPWSAARFNGAGPQPLFDNKHPDGITINGHMPLQVVHALQLLENAIRVAEAALHSTPPKKVVFENPVSRAEGSQFAIKGRELHSPIWNTTLMKQFVARNKMQSVVSDQCRSGADSQKTTNWLCSAGVYESVQTRLGHLMCNHSHGEHRQLVQEHGVATVPAGQALRFSTKDAERFPSELNKSLAEAFLAPVVKGDWFSVVGSCIEPYTNMVVQSLCYSLAELHATSVTESKDPLVLLHEMLVMQLEIDMPAADAIIQSVAPIAATLDAQLSAMAIAGDEARVKSTTSAMAFAVFKVLSEDRKSGDKPSYKQAMSGPDREKWYDAMVSELGNFEEFGIFEELAEDSLPTWSVQRHRASEVVDMIWVLVKKYNEMRELLKFKARGTIRGDQGKAIDIKLNRTPAETYAPTVRVATCKMATARGCVRAYENRNKAGRVKMRYRTSDAKSAFLQGKQPEVDSARIVRPPEGFRKVDRRGVPIVWKLVGNCYGTDTAPRVWFESYVPVLCDQLGFTQSAVDPCHIFKEYPVCPVLPLGGRCDIGLYVDDQLVIDDAGVLCDADMAVLEKLFQFTLTEDPKLFLNMNIQVLSEWSVKFTMEKYLLGIADQCVPNWRSWALLDVPATPNLQTDYELAHARPQVVSASRIRSYRNKVGKLIYAAPQVRADAAYSISRLARAQTFPTEALENHADKVIVHLAQTADMGVTFDGSAPRAAELYAESDSDWAVGHSTSGVAVYHGGAVVYYSSKRQSCIAMSSTEAEIIAASACALVLVFCARLGKDMGLKLVKPPMLYVDNSGAIELSRDRKSCHRSRHVDRRYFKVRELKALGELDVTHIPTADNSADLLTKVLSYLAHAKHRARLLNL